MAHMIDGMWDGVALAEQPAWHHIGKVFDRLMTIDEAWEAGEPTPLSAWDVEMSPMYHYDRNGTMVPVDRFRALERNDNRNVLGIVGDGYEPFKNAQIKAFFSDIIEQAVPDKKCVEVVGSFGNGEAVWVLARMPGKVVIDKQPKDWIAKYLFLVNFNTGFNRARCKPTNVRVVCNNTCQMSLREKGVDMDGIALTHTKSLHKRVEEAKRALRLVNKEFETTDKIANFLAEATVPNAAAFDEYLKALVPDNPDAKYTSRTENIRDAMADAFLDRRHNALPGLEGTWWTAYNAVTRYVDHERTSCDTTRATAHENRVKSFMLGQGARMKADACAFAIQGATGKRFLGGAAVSMPGLAETGLPTVTVDGSDILSDLLSKPVNGKGK